MRVKSGGVPSLAKAVGCLGLPGSVFALPGMGRSFQELIKELVASLLERFETLHTVVANLLYALARG